MFSEHMGVIVTGASGDRLVTRRDQPGHAVYGPYDSSAPGQFRVDFELACDETGGDPGEHVATLDVAAYRGMAILGQRAVLRGDLTAEPRIFSVFFTNLEFRALEYRVDVTGTASLALSAPRLVHLAALPSLAPAVDPTEESSDPVVLAAQVRTVLRLLRPYRCPDFAKVRVGRDGDGGYVMLDDFAGIDTGLSFGINDDISWDSDAADRGLTIHQFDHTVEDPAPHDPRMHFNRKMISTHSSDTTAALPDLIAAYDRGRARPNMLLKMDIEGGEWPMLRAMSADALGRLSQIVCELHYFDWLSDLENRREKWACLSKIHEHFAVVHVHANVVGRSSMIAGVFVPHTLELTFANRALYRFEETDETFPGPLDQSCDPYGPDLWLGSFRY